MESIYTTVPFTRSGMTLCADIPAEWSGNTFVAYLVLSSADNKRISNSQYLGEFICR